MNYFKLAALYFFVFFTSATLISCGDNEETKPEIKGCTDPNSLNYNAGATVSDGTCQYIADAYVGNYVAQDTATYNDSGTGQPVTTISTYSFAIAKTENNEVEVLNFGQNCTLKAKVTTTNLTFVNPGMCGIANVVCYLSNGKLKYRYAQSSFVSQQVNGTAQKQP